jgi:hypothetical protein
VPSLASERIAVMARVPWLDAGAIMKVLDASAGGEQAGHRVRGVTVS